MIVDSAIKQSSSALKAKNETDSVTSWGSGGGSVGRAVASYTRGPRFDSHR